MREPGAHAVRLLGVAVEYSITELGRTLQVPFGAVYEWSIKHLHEIDQAQKAYDQQMPAEQ